KNKGAPGVDKMTVDEVDHYFYQHGHSLVQEIDDYLEGKRVSQQAQETIENLWTKTQHKRHQPITIFDDFWK
ncbi:MAG: hypothetical protein L0H27_02895, partial [Tetragenococcus halophilus]|nr:hypothetical protein [Tetragenococcus halophilus]